MNKKKTAIVLGGTNPHIALIENLKARGYYTVLIDYYENPPAKAAADEHIRESTLDQEKVLEIAKGLGISLVISTSIDQANVTACYVSEKLGLPTPYSYKTALNVTNKGLMKKMMLDSGIPTSKYIRVTSTEMIKNSGLSLPLVVKPSDTTGSKGVRKAETMTELDKYLNDALRISRSKEAIVEEYVEGKEIQIDFFVQNREATLIMMREKIKTGYGGNDIVLQSIGSQIPVEVSLPVYQKIQEIAKTIVNTFNLENTSLFIQAIVNKNAVNVIEFASRIGGGLSYSIIKIITGFDILSATVDSFLGIQTNVIYKQPASFYSTSLIYAQPGVFDHITGHRELIEEGVIEEFYFFKTKGMNIDSNMTSGDRIGAFLVKAKSKMELDEKIMTAVNRLEVYNKDGLPIMRKEIFQTQLNKNAKM